MSQANKDIMAKANEVKNDEKMAHVGLVDSQLYNDWIHSHTEFLEASKSILHKSPYMSPNTSLLMHVPNQL